MIHDYRDDYRDKAITDFYDIFIYTNGDGIYLLPTIDCISVVVNGSLMASNFSVPGIHTILQSFLNPDNVKPDNVNPDNVKPDINEDFILKLVAVCSGKVKDVEL